ncbi:hypothetical protein [Saccharothrix yanglingensis]|uniref:hypothetical protein n=1 Tax=Saccharothrix yanglingensis TaxID=659496 RepID=UPI0027D2C678|nr:hypothetical protein [Saccharothrix yanglingensis]
MDDDVRRARDEVVNMVALRPSPAPADPRTLPGRHDLRLAVAAGVLDLLAAVAATLLGPDRWITSAAGVVVGITGFNTVVDGVREARRRAREAARFREHGPDEADTLAVLRVDAAAPHWIAVVAALRDLLLTTLVVAVLVRVWPEGTLARVVMVAALACRLAAAVLVRRHARRSARWQRDFLGAEGIATPPLPARRRVIAPRSRRPTTRRE